MREIIDLTGEVFGRLTVLGLSNIRHKKGVNWLCLCHCGNFKIVTRGNLKNGDVKSCGCITREKPNSQTHGKTYTTEYKRWCNIKERCYNPNNHAYVNYGGRGIKMCARWLESFENFLEDMGEVPDPNATIERVDVNKDYCKDNCKWLHHDMQSRNRRKFKNNTSGFSGVCLQTKGGEETSYTARWQTLDGKTKSKSFSINKYGKEEAFRLACEARENAIKELNEQGAGYSDNHGK